MTTLDIVVRDDHVDVSVTARAWSVRVPNSIVVKTDRRGERRVVGISGLGESAGADALRPFDPTNFDPALAQAFIRYWSHEHARSGTPPERFRAALSTVSIDLVWSSWSQLPAADRRAFLRFAIAPFASVSINGRLAGRWNGLRVALGLGPAMEDWAVT